MVTLTLCLFVLNCLAVTTHGFTLSEEVEDGGGASLASMEEFDSFEDEMITETSGPLTKKDLVLMEQRLTERIIKLTSRLGNIEKHILPKKIKLPLSTANIPLNIEFKPEWHLLLIAIQGDFHEDTLYKQWGEVVKSLGHKWTRYSQVRFSTITKDDERHWVTFSTRGASRYSWFTPSRVIDTSFTDLKGNERLKSNRIFSIKGHVNIVRRRFYAQSKHGGCAKDFGWFAVLDTDTQSVCNWEKRDAELPTFLVCPAHKECNFEDAVIGKAILIEAKLRESVHTKM